MFIREIATIIRLCNGYTHRKLHNTNITRAEHAIVEYLYAHDPVNQETIAHSLGNDKGAIAKNLLSLEEKGLVSRCENKKNRREKLVSLTTTGKASVAEIMGIYDEWNNLVLEDLEEEEKKQFLLLCKKVLEKSKQINEKERCYNER